MAKVLLLTAKSETSFQSFVLMIHVWEIYQHQDGHQTSIQMF